MKIERFEDLEVWIDARQFSKKIFEITNHESFSKDFRFRDQVRSSAGSIMDNIAEGFERDGIKEFIHFLSIAKASCGELRSQCHRAFDYNYITEIEYKELTDGCISISRQLSGFINYLKKSGYRGTKFREG